MLRAFRSVVGGDEAPRKPSPAGLLALCRALDASPPEVVLIGDSTVDVTTGRAAGGARLRSDLGSGGPR